MKPEDTIDHRKQKPFCYRNEQGYHINYYLEAGESIEQVDTEKLKEQGFYVYEYEVHNNRYRK